MRLPLQLLLLLAQPLSSLEAQKLAVSLRTGGLPAESGEALRVVVKVERACCDENVQNDPQPIVAGFLVAINEVAASHRIQGAATVQA
jgi:hypothetical protein